MPVSTAIDIAVNKNILFIMTSFSLLIKFDGAKIGKKIGNANFMTDIDTPLDMDNDGIADVIYFTTNDKRDAALKLVPESERSKVMTRLITTDLTSSNLQAHAVAGGGYNLSWDSQEDNVRVFGKKQYLYPIPAMVMVRNPNITQNPGWENNASNDGN